MGSLIFRASGLRSGFTLIEILVVVAILAIAAGSAVLVLDRDERDVVVREARRFAGAIEYATSRAQVRAETLGISADGSGWRFWLRDARGNWTPVIGDDALSPRAFPTPITARALSYGARAVPSDAIVPLRASGRNEPYAFEFVTPRFRVQVAADPVNRVTIAGPQATSP